MIGLRPGEKLYEELLIGDNPSPTQHTGIMQAKESFLALGELMKELEHLNKNMNSHSIHKVIEQLKNLVSGFSPDLRYRD